MDNQEKPGGRFRVCEEPYNLDAYRSLIRHALDLGFGCRPFTAPATTGKDLFLRHDVDVSLEWAARLGQVNAELGVGATFFVQTRSPLYNLFSHDSVRALDRLRGCGQHLGLHLCLPPGRHGPQGLPQLIQGEMALLRQAAPDCHPVFSWHNPGLLQEAGEGFVHQDFPGLVNAYGRVAGHRLPFFSESNLRHSPAQLRQIISQAGGSFQLCLHPFIWLAGKRTQVETVAAAIANSARVAGGELGINYVFRRAWPQGMPEGPLQRLEAELGRLRLVELGWLPEGDGQV